MHITILYATEPEKMLVPEVITEDVVVLDNASFHKSEKTRKLIKNAGCKLIFLPPYSPDLNPIEHFWDWMKNKVRDIAHLFQTLEFAIMAAANIK